MLVAGDSEPLLWPLDVIMHQILSLEPREGVDDVSCSSEYIGDPAHTHALPLHTDAQRPVS